MSIDATLKINGISSKPVSLKDVMEIIGDSYGYGMMNNEYVLQELDVNDYDDKYVVIYNKERLGRGFELHLSKQNKTIKMFQPAPCTKTDIFSFYDVIDKLCKMLKLTSFLIDEKEYSINELMTLRDNHREWVKSILKEHYGADYLPYVFGAILPISVIQEEVFKNENQSDEETEVIFEEYLHKLQSQDLYYASTLLYKNNVTEEIDAVYVLTKGVATIFPIKQQLPIMMREKFTPTEWVLWFYDIETEKMFAKISFEAFAEKVELERFPLFDREHIIIELNDEILSKLDLEIIS